MRSALAGQGATLLTSARTARPENCGTSAGTTLAGIPGSTCRSVSTGTKTMARSFAPAGATLATVSPRCTNTVAGAAISIRVPPRGARSVTICPLEVRSVAIASPGCTLSPTATPMRSIVPSSAAVTRAAPAPATNAPRPETVTGMVPKTAHNNAIAISPSSAARASPLRAETIVIASSSRSTASMAATASARKIGSLPLPLDTLDQRTQTSRVFEVFVQVSGHVGFPGVVGAERTALLLRGIISAHFRARRVNRARSRLGIEEIARKVICAGAVLAERDQHLLEKPASAGLLRLASKLTKLFQRQMVVPETDGPEIEATIARACTDRLGHCAPCHFTAAGLPLYTKGGRLHALEVRSTKPSHLHGPGNNLRRHQIVTLEVIMADQNVKDRDDDGEQQKKKNSAEQLDEKELDQVSGGGAVDSFLKIDFNHNADFNRNA